MEENVEALENETGFESSIIRPSIVSADGDAILTEAGFETAYQKGVFTQDDERGTVIAQGVH